MSVTTLQKCKMNRVSVGVGVCDSEWVIKTTSLRRKICKGVLRYLNKVPKRQCARFGSNDSE
jgi:hypothetical protein